ncbi:hypothetical protein SKAU_G00045770 [Synaphobranchus kaupii]|uniref:Uncharacterized protein n=1 Tax=Synaphobranchus kaupii TaxID=118154 RepID=A0A9Q1J998_SYNKA|nr:hypothetical protein SKAU_G00045770 [Synaphobranchus kaupii]
MPSVLIGAQANTTSLLAPSSADRWEMSAGLPRLSDSQPGFADDRNLCSREGGKTSFRTAAAYESHYMTGSAFS